MDASRLMTDRGDAINEVTNCDAGVVNRADRDVFGSHLTIELYFRCSGEMNISYFLFEKSY